MDDTVSAATKLPDPVELSRAVANIAERSQKVVADFLARQKTEFPPGGPGAAAGPATGAAKGAGAGINLGMGQADPVKMAGAFFEMTARLMANPGSLVQAQMGLWNDHLRLWQRTTEKFLSGEPGQPVIEPGSGDRRFRSPLWEENALFDFIKQSYLLSARFVQNTVRSIEGLDDKTARKLDFYTRQLVDAMAPSNFVMTNLEVLRTTIETGGENLLNGLSNMLDDLERGKGQLAIRMTDLEAFTLGETIATAPGKVVFQNELIQLLQYAPTTDTVNRRPLLIMPPWINKFYILDLKPKNSFIRWAVAQGHTVFVISWVNPDQRLAQRSFEDYMTEGFFAALDAVEQATGEREVNVIGYCIGGTLLATSLAYLAAKKDTRVKSATYFTTMIDFTESGELSVFIDEDQLQALELRISEKGYLEGRDMFNTFNMLRANDLIWSFVVNNYLMGKEPFPFDLLYWNSDATRMPQAMHMFYLRNMYQENRLIQPGGITMKGVPIDITTIEVPSFLLATKEDHIAPWRSSYAATRYYKGPTTFCLSGSGHIAGVVNPPADMKYMHWTSPSLPEKPDDWFAAATQHPGSWWPTWNSWVSQFAGGTVPARIPGDGKLPALEDAPGSYVKVREA